jgi:hypothetical protein
VRALIILNTPKAPVEICPLFEFQRCGSAMGISWWGRRRLSQRDKKTCGAESRAAPCIAANPCAKAYNSGERTTVGVLGLLRSLAPQKIQLPAYIIILPA